MFRLFSIIIATAITLFSCQNQANTAKNSVKMEKSIVFVGTYTKKMGHVDGKASGIYSCYLDKEKGTLTPFDSVGNILNPSFICLSPDKKFLYAVSEGGEKDDKIVSFSVSTTGKLTKIDEKPSLGAAPCYISVDNTGKYVFVANYAGGNIVSYEVLGDGKLGNLVANIKHTAAKDAWAHQIRPTADNRFLLACDKGADKIYIYNFENGKISKKDSISTNLGDGPRHFDFNAKQDKIFVINELNNSINTYTFDNQNGSLQFMEKYPTLPKDFKAINYCADIHVHPSGKFLFGSNRGHNSIVSYQIEEATGKLNFIENVSTKGDFPRNFMLSKDGKLLLAANQNTSNVTTFLIDENTGKLNFLAESKIFTPVCLLEFGH